MPGRRDALRGDPHAELLARDVPVSAVGVQPENHAHPDPASLVHRALERHEQRVHAGPAPLGQHREPALDHPLHGRGHVAALRRLA